MHARSPSGASDATGRVCLSTRDRFAGKDRFLNLQAVCLQQPQVGGYLVPGFQQHHISCHQGVAINRLALAVAQYRCPRGQHAANGRHGLFRLAFLNKADRGVGEDDGQNDRRVDQVAEGCRDHGRPQEHVDQDVVEVQQEAQDRAALSGFGQTVGTVGLQAGIGFILRKAMD